MARWRCAAAPACVAGVVNHGTLSFTWEGSGQTTAQYAIVGSLSQSGTGTLVLNASPGGNNILHVVGTAALGGTFVLNTNGWMPPPFSGFQLIEATVLTCSFALSLPSLWPGCWWTPTYTEHWFYLSVQDGMGI